MIGKDDWFYWIKGVVDIFLGLIVFYGVQSNVLMLH